ncbi:family 78 glycoside hydrolase catalytic domain [Lysinibacter cavernae]|uniref:alpha-L-rhamnosidase n=1 Tax=Lysinibacter cavernae TaxID=1640652 RepID=A0A7X5R1V8_9MICO|nr:family 78 glycoside hydrolase catalytic domain [Lysinibacter cavernae]NIH54026.1 hypothetical protein [Lysinibacter cavernae]
MARTTTSHLPARHDSSATPAAAPAVTPAVTQAATPAPAPTSSTRGATQRNLTTRIASTRFATTRTASTKSASTKSASTRTAPTHTASTRTAPTKSLLTKTTVALTLAGLLFSGITLGSTVSATSAAAAPAAVAGTLETTNLRTNGLTNPLGITGDAPILSWQNASSGRGIQQSAYEIRVGSSEATVGAADVWSSGKVESAEQLNVAYGGPALTSQTRYVWQVRTWDNTGTGSDWSAPASFETAILNGNEWTADWISGPDPAVQLAAWTDYTVSVDFTLDNLVLGLFARASDLNNAYMWQLSVADGTPRFRPHVRTNGGYSLLESKDISSFISLDELKTGTHNFSVTFDGSTIISTLDGEEIDRRTNTQHARGYVGFRQSTATEGSENSTVHKITVTNSNDTVLLNTDFSDGKNPFTGGTIADGALKLVSPVEAIYRADAAEPIMRKDFSVEKTVTSARVYASARGVYELSINGEKVGDELLAPGWTDYSKRIKFQTYDVTDLLAAGDNTIGAMLADGWYTGHIASFGTNIYGNSTSVIAQMRIDYSDGTHDWVGTDSSWKSNAGPLIESDMIMGERYDARMSRTGWDSPGYDDSSWTAAGTAPTSATALLEPQTDQPVRVTELRTPITRTESAPGTWIYDMAQNMVGVAELNLTGVAGETATIRYGEMLNPDGTLYTANLRSAKATDYYTFATTGAETYTPKFTFHGFRYLEITGVATPPTVDQVTGHVWGSDLPVTGKLETSSGMLNQLQSNITWGQRGNFLSIPTDTPARDERLGWTGDINVFAPTASYNQDTLTFLGKWLGDLRDSQSANGDLPGVSPTPGCCGGGTGWSDAGITVPFTLWQTYGDTGVVLENYDMMKKFMEYVENSAGPSLIRESGPYGDWLNLDDNTSPALLGTAYYAYISNLFSQMADAVGNTADAEHYADLSNRVRDAFVERFILADGTVQGNSQAGYAMAIGMDLVPAERLEAVGNKYVAKLASKDFHLSTGFLGTSWLLPALTKSGHQDIAYRLLNNDTYPSWGYEVVSGATTMWERWDSLKPDGSFGDVGMNSFNHYAYGAVGDWMYQNIGGITVTGAGYKTFDIAPSIGGGLTHGTGEFASVYGNIRSSWAQTDGGMTLEAEVPVGTTATVRIPALNSWSVLEDGKPLSEVAGVTVVSEGSGTVVLEVGSGSYAFSSDPANSGLVVDLLTTDDVLPGTTVNGTVRVTNTGATPVTGLTAALSVSGGLAAEPALVSQATLAAGASADLAFAVMIPVATPAGPLSVTADVSAIVGGDARSFSVVTTVTNIQPAITFDAVSALASAGDPAEVVTVTSTVSNVAASSITGHFVVDVPAGWPTPAVSRTVTVKPGATATADVVAAVPLTVTETEYPLTVRFVHDAATLGTGSTSIAIALPVPPSEFTDHVDFGESGSETAHAVKSSGNGGTTVEAGLTRRYSGIATIGSWFSADLSVTPNEPFILRGIETYDQAQLKSYDVYVNDVLVDSRLYQRSQGGAGLVNFQMLIPDDGTLTASGKVTVKVRFNGVGTHDPSLADLWTMPVPADTIAPSVYLDASIPGAEGWFLGGSEVTLTATDARSDVASIEYSTDGSTWFDYDAPIALTEGSTDFSFRATDTAGNVSAAQSETLQMDATAPTAWAWLGKDGRLTSVASDNLSGVATVEYSVDGETWLPSLTALTLAHPDLASVKLRATDVAGNVSDVLTEEPREGAPRLTVAAGDKLTLASSGFAVGAKVRVELHSDPVVLGRSVADAAGVITLSATVPASVGPGEHTLVFAVEAVGPVDPGTPTTPGGNGGTVVIPVDVAGGNGLTNTGSSADLLAWFAAALLLLGAGITGQQLIRRRRESAS